MIRTHGDDTRVISVDITLPATANDERVTFLEGDARELDRVLTPELLASLPRPWRRGTILGRIRKEMRGT